MKQQGYTLAGALILIAILSIFMAVSVPLWTRIKQRENEEELIFRGKEYMEAIARYHARFHSYPPDLETLYKQKFVRKLYKDPMTESGKWKVLHPDSLVQTGAAGQINQPGQPSDQEKNENEPGQIPTGFAADSEKAKKGDNSGEITEDTENGSKEETTEEPETESTGPVVGVVSRSKKTSIKIYNNQEKYNKWVFVFSPPQELAPQQPGDKGKPGKPGKPGAKGQPKQGKNPPSQQPDEIETNP